MTDERREWLERVRGAADRAAESLRCADDPHLRAMTEGLDSLSKRLGDELARELRAADR